MKEKNIVVIVIIIVILLYIVLFLGMKYGVFYPKKGKVLDYDYKVIKSDNIVGNTISRGTAWCSMEYAGYETIIKDDSIKYIIRDCTNYCSPKNKANIFIKNVKSINNNIEIIVTKAKHRKSKHDDFKKVETCYVETAIEFKPKPNPNNIIIKFDDGTKVKRNGSI